jgi:hypothetical protein
LALLSHGKIYNARDTYKALCQGSVRMVGNLEEKGTSQVQVICVAGDARQTLDFI